MANPQTAQTKRAAAFHAIKRVETLLALTKDDAFLQEVFTSAHQVVSRQMNSKVSANQTRPRRLTGVH